MKKNKKIAIIYGSDTGMTEEITERIHDKLNIDPLTIFEINELNPNDFLKFDVLILGIPTWDVGELQSDWDEFYPDFKNINFENIKVCMYGLGDQLGYPDNFVDGLGILGSVILKNGGLIFGYWPNKGYKFNLSKGISPNGMFYGLALDEHNQYEQTDTRIDNWILKIKSEINTF